MLLTVILKAWPLVLCLVFEVQCHFYTRKYRTHTLVQLAGRLDLSPLEQACAGFHQGSGKGSAVTHPVPRLVRALLLKYLQNLSFRQTEAEIELNLLARWFVGYSWLETPPDHTTLCRFELWVLRHQPRLFFDFILDLILSYCPEERQRLLLTDTFGMFARGARTWTIELLRDLCRRLLSDLQQIDPVLQQAILAQVDAVALFGQAGELLTPALKPEERAQRLQSVVNASLELHDLLLARLDQPPFLSCEAEIGLRLWLATIAKVIADETVVSPDPDRPGRRLITERPHGKKGPYRIACANDLDATYRDHGKGSAELQYNAGLLTSARFIHETEVVTGAAPDPVTLPPMLEQLHQQHGFFPPKVVADQIYGTGKTRALVDQVSQGQTQLVALVPDYEKRTDRFVPADFMLSEDGLSLTCPNGVTTAKVFPKPGYDGREFRFLAKMCQGCPFWLTADQLAQDPTLPHCRVPDCKPNSHRQVFVSQHRDFLLAALKYNQTEQFKLEIKQRPLIERIIFNLTHFFGARYAHSTGLPKVNFQLRMAAAAFNLRELLRVLAHRPGSAAA
jgi:hypothetical protein